LASGAAFKEKRQLSFDPTAQPCVRNPPDAVGRVFGAIPKADLTPQAIEQALAQSASPAVPPDHDDSFGVLVSTQPVQAAVLVPIVQRAAGPQVMLTRRAAHLRQHAGQISFPGGRRDAGDPSALQTALREAHEETGLPAHAVEVLGRLPEYLTGTGFMVTPFVAWVDPPSRWVPDPFEVEQVFEVPLEFLMNPANHYLHELPPGSGRRCYWSMPWQDQFIWGATAGMLRRLYWMLGPGRA
jgi:8-oxo-dGTP pyrophosphatase MutT (NUDIX family)